MSNVYKTVLLEIRPRLQCVNAFITLLSNHNSLEVVLDHEAILLLVEKNVTKIHCKGIKIVINSLSSLNVTDKNVSFRFLTKNPFEKVGSFKTEFLQNTVASIESLSNKPLLSKCKQYIVHCINCKNPLSDPIEFDRILPLPSENSDVNDFFCHNHGKSNDPISLDPKPTDIFYSQCFVHMNVCCISNIKVSNKVLVCKFCLQWLGTKHNSNTIKLWFNTVRFSSDKGLVSSSSLEDTFQTIKNCLKYSLHNTAKIILSCQTSPTNVDNLLLWVLEKKLQILFGTGNVKEHNVAKVLFKFINKDEPVLEQWQNDSLVTNVDISKPMMIDLLTNLHKNNKLFPLEYSKSNDFSVSYLFLYDNF